MFGMGFAEIMLIAVIAILFLGPDKLPQTLIDIARFFRNVKKTVATAKASIQEELHVEDIRKEAASYKEELLNSSRELERMSSVKEQLQDVKKLTDTPVETPKTPAAPAKPEVVTFAKKSKSAAEKPDEASKDA